MLWRAFPSIIVAVAAALVFNHRAASGFVHPLAPLTSTRTRRCTKANSSPGTALSAIQDATFGMGCFWKPSESMLSVPGVTSTLAGYSGKPDASKPPTYEDVCASREWVEVVRVTYDDERISYPQLLDAFFDASEANPGARQYASIIFPSEEQKPLAEEWLTRARKEERTSKNGVPARFTTIEPLSKTFKAENYHQEFWQKNRPRFAMGFLLMAIASGALNGIIPSADLAHNVKTLANGSFLVGALATQAERWLDKEVVEV